MGITMETTARKRKAHTNTKANAPASTAKGNGQSRPLAAPVHTADGGASPLAQGMVKSAPPRIGLGLAVQRKVLIGPPDDPYEREADRVAAHVTAGEAAPPISRLAAGGLAQRQSTAEEEEPVQTLAVQRQSSAEEDEMVQPLLVQRQPMAEEEEPVQTLAVQRQSSAEEEEPVQMAPTTGSSVGGSSVGGATSAATTPHPTMRAAAGDAIHQSGPGLPLHPTTRTQLEGSLGTDLGSVRVHNDSRAQRSNQLLRARAFTHGNHIWLGTGESQNDLALMAHETTHVLQQGGVVRRQMVDEEEDEATDGGRAGNGLSSFTAGAAATTAAPLSSTPALTEAPITESGAGDGDAALAGLLTPPLGAPQPAPPPTAAAMVPTASGTTTASAATTGEAATGEATTDQAVVGEEGTVEAATGEAPTAAAGEAPTAGEGTGAGANGAAPSAAGGGGGAGTTVELLMPPPPTGLSAAETQRLAGVENRVAATGTAAATLPNADAQVGEARGAVEEPAAETQARAEGTLVAALEQRPEPSPEIEELCDRIYRIIRAKRPPDEDSLVDADPHEMAQEAGGQLDSAVEGDANRVEGSYNELQQEPAGTPQQQPQPMTEVPTAVNGPAIDATAATPTGVTADAVSLDADVNASQTRMDEAGMTSETASLIQDPSNPVVQARETQGELAETAQREPAEVMAEQQTALGDARADMAALQQRALASLQQSRTATVQGTRGQQNTMVGSEGDMRTQVSNQARTIVSQARTDVQNLLRPLPETARTMWERGVAVLSTTFEQDLARVKRWIDDRHSGVGGALLGVADYLTGLPDWVTEEYDRAEQAFGDGVCDLLREISAEVNAVIAAAEALIANANQQVDELFSDLPAELQEWATGEREQLNGQLNDLHNQVQQTQSNINRELTESAAGAVQQVRERIDQLRQEAGGLLGRIADMVNRFLDDPIKFIIDGLLSLVGIAPASFWALVNRIQQVISDIADDPLGFAQNLLAAIGQGFQQFFDKFGEHLLAGFWDWLFSGLGSVGVEIPSDFSLKSIITFILQLLGITWPRIRALLAKHIGEENIALIEKAWELVSTLIELGPEGIFEMIKEQLNPQEIINQILQAAIDYLIETLIQQVTVRVAMLFNPVGAVAQAIEAIYKVLKWIFENAARIFSLIETIVNGMADIVAGNIGGMANAVEGALARLIAPVIDFIAGLVGLGDLPDKIADVIRGLQEWVEGILDRVIGWLAGRARSLLAALGIGEEEEEEADPTDHVAFAQAAAEYIKAIPHGDYDTTRAAAEQIAAEKEPQLSAQLEEGIGLRYVFADRQSDEADADLDFQVIIAPNTTTHDDKVEVELGGEIITIWVVNEKRVQLSLDPEDPEYTVSLHPEASPAMALQRVMGLGVEIDQQAAEAFIAELNSRGILRTDRTRTLLISFAQTGPAAPLEYLRGNLKLGRASRAARQIPTGSQRHLLVDRGATTEGEQRVTLSNYASVFYESYVGQFKSRQVQSDANQEGSKAIEFVFDSHEQPRVRNLGIVRVGDDGTIVEIVETTNEVSSGAEFIQIMERAGWTVRLE